MEKIKVGVIFGGQSTEHDVSVVSGSSVIKNLNKEKYEIYPIYISKNGEWFHYIKPVQDIEELNHISTTIEGICKIVNEKLKNPVFVKPSNSGSSVGVSKAENDEELKNSIQEAAKYDKEILIEQGINGKEIECAVLGMDDVKASCVGQILSADEFYDYDSKYKNAESKTIIPADVSKEISEKIRKTAIKAFKAVKGSGLARVDFFVDKETDEIYLNEINTMPGFTNISMYPKLWENCGLTYSELLDRLIEQEL